MDSHDAGKKFSMRSDGGLCRCVLADSSVCMNPIKSMTDTHLVVCENVRRFLTEHF